MGAMETVVVLVFFLGSWTTCSGNQPITTKHTDNEDYGLEKILKAVLVHESAVHGKHAGRFESHSGEQEIQRSHFQGSQHSPSFSYGFANSNSGYMYLNPNNGKKPHEAEQFYNSKQGKSPNVEGYNYESLKTHADQGVQYNQHVAYQYMMQNPKGYQYQNPALHNGRGAKQGYHYSGQNNQNVEENTHSENNGYHYNVPSKGFEEGFHTHQNIINGYASNKPEGSLGTQSTFKAQPYLPVPSPLYGQSEITNSGFQNEPFSTQPKVGFFSKYHQYNSPTEAVFKGPSYLPLVSPPKDSNRYEVSRPVSTHGYTYQRTS